MGTSSFWALLNNNLESNRGLSCPERIHHICLGVLIYDRCLCPSQRVILLWSSKQSCFRYNVRFVALFLCLLAARPKPWLSTSVNVISREYSGGFLKEELIRFDGHGSNRPYLLVNAGTPESLQGFFFQIWCRLNSEQTSQKTSQQCLVHLCCKQRWKIKGFDWMWNCEVGCWQGRELVFT